MAVDALQYLSAVPMFRAATKKELKQIARLVEEHHVAAGEILVREGHLGHEFYVLADGKAEVTRDGNVIATLGAGDYFGELSLLDPGPRNATVTMASDGEVLILCQREFYSLLDQMPTVARSLLVGMARRLHDSDARPVR